MLENAPKQFKIHTAFIYVTEKCNLKCTYCYFKHKKGRDIVPERLRAFFDRLIQLEIVPQKFEISGGEPLLCWDKVKTVVRDIKRYFPEKRIGIQTNGLFLTRDKVMWLKMHKMALEIGIDGDMSVTTRWRTKMGDEGYARLLSNIRLCVEQGLSVGCNMTVHPEEAGSVLKGFKLLKSLGIRSVDVTPAAFMSWDEKSIKIFKEQYLELLQSVHKTTGVYTSEDTKFFDRLFLDVSFHPPGHVLCGDVYLCLSEKKKVQYSMWNYKKNKFRLEALKFFIKSYGAEMKRLGQKGYAHRDYVCSGFEIISQIAGKKYLNTDEMIMLMRFLKRAHLAAR